METTQMDKRQKRVYQGIILFLLLLIIVLVWKLVTIKTGVDTIIIEKDKAVAQTTELQSELDALMAEHARIKEEYGMLTDQLSERDSLIMAQAQEIEMLINSQADYRRVKRQLDYLRSITQGYVSQIDSLYEINQLLVEENQVIRQDLLTEQQRSFDLTQDKENLEGQITSEAYLRAYAVNAKTLSVKTNGKEAETDKARRTDVIRVCFTLGENSLVPAGTKDVYVRIARPDNLILTQGSYSFLYQGERIQFTEKTSVQYNKKSQSVCVSYRRGDVELLPGVYHVNVFADDRMIGECSFKLN
jgi:cell division protein FtsB